jgi:hypothetical protein
MPSRESACVGVPGLQFEAMKSPGRTNSSFIMPVRLWARGSAIYFPNFGTFWGKTVESSDSNPHLARDPLPAGALFKLVQTTAQIFQECFTLISQRRGLMLSKCLKISYYYFINIYTYTCFTTRLNASRLSPTLMLRINAK